MAFKKLSAVSLTDMFTEELKRMILSGELRSGERLPPERDLAEEMNVSLAVVHAGVTRLTAQGFLHVTPRKGTFVADYLRTGDLNTMMAIVDYSGRTLDSDAFDLLIAFRRSFELMVIKRACEHRTEEDLRRLEEVLRRIHARGEDDLPELCFTFYHELAMSSGNPYCPMVIQSFRPVYVFFYKQTVLHGDFDVALAKILDAVRLKDPERAEAAIQENIDRWNEDFKKTEKFRRN